MHELQRLTDCMISRGLARGLQRCDAEDLAAQAWLVLLRRGELPSAVHEHARQAFVIRALKWVELKAWTAARRRKRAALLVPLEEAAHVARGDSPFDVLAAKELAASLNFQTQSRPGMTGAERTRLCRARRAAKQKIAA